jgi:hypothetical protein
MANDRGGHDNITVVIARVKSIKGRRASSQGPAKRSGVPTLQYKTVIRKTGTPRTLFKKTFLILSAPLWVLPWVLKRLIRGLARTIFGKNAPGKG